MTPHTNLRTPEQMDEKDWIILRHHTLLLNIAGYGVLDIPDYRETSCWLFNNLNLGQSRFMAHDDPLAKIIATQQEQLSTLPPFPTVAAWPYTKLDEPTPDECLVVTQMENA